MRLLAFALLLVALPACSSSSSNDVAYGVSDAALTDSGACNTLDNLAPEISETVVATAQPTPQGGTIGPGLYFETSFVRYESKAIATDAGIAAVHRLTAQIASDLTMMVAARALDTGIESRYFFRLEPQGNGKLRYTFLCPTGLGFTDYGYDAAPGTLTIYFTDKWGPFGYTMQKQ